MVNLREQPASLHAKGLTPKKKHYLYNFSQLRNFPKVQQTLMES